MKTCNSSSSPQLVVVMMIALLVVMVHQLLLALLQSVANALANQLPIRLRNRQHTTDGLHLRPCLTARSVGITSNNDTLVPIVPFAKAPRIDSISILRARLRLTRRLSLHGWRRSPSRDSRLRPRFNVYIMFASLVLSLPLLFLIPILFVGVHSVFLLHSFLHWPVWFLHIPVFIFPRAAPMFPSPAQSSLHCFHIPKSALSFRRPARSSKSFLFPACPACLFRHLKSAPSFRRPAGSAMSFLFPARPACLFRHLKSALSFRRPARSAMRFLFPACTTPIKLLSFR